MGPNIKGNLERIFQFPQNVRGQLSESLAQIDSQDNRCKRIAHSLLRFSPRTKSVIETVNINEFLQEVVDLMEREARTSGIKFITNLNSHVKPILSDPSQLQQVFLNIMTNAIDVHDGKHYGHIRISTEADDKNKRIKIVFSDTGSGISKENLGKIFDPFFTSNMSKLLVNRGYRVTAINSGDAAIRAMENDDFDVVVLDLKMPGMDAITTLKEVKKLGLFTETLILTGHGSIDTALEAIKLGAYDYLTKTCEINDLVEKIEGAWEKKDDAEKQDIQEKIQKVVESPSSVFEVFPKKKGQCVRFTGFHPLYSPIA